MQRSKLGGASCKGAQQHVAILVRFSNLAELAAELATQLAQG
jgi:hypothetical protein